MKQSHPVLSQTVTLVLIYITLKLNFEQNTLESNISTTKVKSPSSGDVPFLCTNFNAKDLKSNAENIVIKNNKYYITKKLKSPSNPKNTLQQEISSIDKKDETPSLTYSLPSRNKTNKKDTSGKLAHGYSPRRDQENNVSPKFFLDKQQSQIPPDLFEDYPMEQTKVERPPLVAKQINGTLDSPKTQTVYGKLTKKLVKINW